MNEMLRSTIERANPRGDVAVCGSPTPADAGGDPLVSERIAFLAPLDSRFDLECILRELLRAPGVHHVIVRGDDPRAHGEALVSVLRDGLDDRGRLRDARGSICGDLDAQTVDTLRTGVEVWDWREKRANELGAEIDALSTSAATREAVSLADPEVPRRKVFLSRRTSFPIFSTDVGDSWLQLMNLALKIGSASSTREGLVHAEALNAMVTIGLPVIAEDLEVEQPVDRKEHADYLDFNPGDFDRYYRRLVTSPQPPSATARLHQLHGADRVAAVAEELRNAASADSTTLLFTSPGGANGSPAAPGVLSGSFDVADGTLYASFVFRCADLYTDWPLEAMALIRLHRELAAQLELEAGATTFVIHAARLYARDWQRAQALLDAHFQRPLPLQVDHSGVFLFGNDGGKARAMLLDHDAGTIFWEDAFDTAQELSWFIVDAMPWLLPQHIRYVGQECSTLTRAMEEKACYLQG